MQRDTLRQQAIAVVRQRILTGRLPAGARINETWLASEIGVSRTPLREALLALQREGYLASEPGRGFFVTPLSIGDARDTYEMVWSLELLALGAADFPDAGRLKELAAINAKLAAPGLGPAEAIALDDAWHETLLGEVPNRRLRRVLADLKRALYRYDYAFFMDEHQRAASVRQHAGILRALRGGDRRRASALLEANWRAGLDALQGRLGDSDGAGKNAGAARSGAVP